MTERAGTWIQTYSGLQLWPLDPREDEICIEDIAHGLALECRWGRQCREFYSVAQHSVYVSYLCDEEDALAGLLHDGAEAYLGDVPRPIKHDLDFSWYRLIENRLQSCIYRKFGLPECKPPSVQQADSELMQLESIVLMGPRVAPWGPAQGPDVPPAEIALTDLWTPAEAERIFLARFHVLTKQHEMGVGPQKKEAQ